MSSNPDPVPDPVPSGDPKVNSKIHTSIYYSFKCNNIEAFKLRSKNKYKLKFKCSNMKEGSYTRDGNTIKKGKKLDKMISEYSSKYFSSDDSSFKDNFKDNFEKAYVEDVKCMSLGDMNYHVLKTNDGSNYKFSVTKAYIKDGALCVIAESNDKLTNIKQHSDDITYIGFITLTVDRLIDAFPCVNNPRGSYWTWAWQQLTFQQALHIRHILFTGGSETWFWADRRAILPNVLNILNTGILRRSATGYPYAFVNPDTWRGCTRI
jgi:hypothetical protein